MISLINTISVISPNVNSMQLITQKILLMSTWLGLLTTPKENSGTRIKKFSKVLLIGITIPEWKTWKTVAKS